MHAVCFGKYKTIVCAAAFVVQNGCVFFKKTGRKRMIVRCILFIYYRRKKREIQAPKAERNFG